MEWHANRRGGQGVLKGAGWTTGKRSATEDRVVRFERSARRVDVTRQQRTLHVQTVNSGQETKFREGPRQGWTPVDPVGFGPW